MAKDKPSKSKTSDEKLLVRVKRWFKSTTDAEARQRERERDDLSFQVPENQWDEASKAQRRGGIVGGQVTPPRPMLTISLLTQPYQLILNQAMNAHLGVEIHPVSEDADEDQAEVRQGLYRRIERDSNAQIARLHAFGRAVLCGRGWYRVNTKYDEDSDQTADQEIVIERILNQESVYMDPAAQQPDYSDARWGMIVGYVPVDTFKREYPGKQIPTGATEFKMWAESDPDWVNEDENEPGILVAECFYKVFEKDRVTAVKYCKVTGREVIEEQDWNGLYIPIVHVFGRELYSFDGERRWEGLVRQARDGQKFTNFAASSLVEAMALEPKSPWVMAEGQ